MRRTNLLLKVIAAALMTLILSAAAGSYSVHAQGAIGQGDPTGADDRHREGRHRQGRGEPDAH